jgi:hypothetical protein
MRFEKLAQQREERDLKARLVPASLTASQTSTATGIPEGYTKISALTSATGVFTIVYLTPFVRLPILYATCFHATLKLYFTVTAQALTGCTIKCWDEGGVAQNPTQILFKAEGFDVADQV